MEKGEKLTGGPYWTQNWIEAMWRFTAERFVDFDTGTVDFEALGREEYEFRKALFFRNFKNSPRARDAFDAAADDYCKKVANGQKGGRPRNNQDNTADGDTREGSQAKPDGSAITRNETRAHDALEPSATISQDAAHRKGADDSKAPTSCNHYDQETDRWISTDEALDLLRAGVMDSSPAPTRRCSAMPSDVGEVYAFAAADGLDSVDAYECWSATLARGGKTADGRKVRNWKAYVRRWCSTRAKKRRTA